jgi:hypothetical protein
MDVMSTITLEQIGVPHPCPIDESDIEGSGSVRFCPHCRQNVYDLSAMTRAEAERLVCQKAGNLCVLFGQTSDGQIVTLDYQAASPRAPWRWPTLAAIGFAGGLATAAMFAQPMFTSRVRGGMTCRMPTRQVGPYATGYATTAPTPNSAADDFNLDPVSDINNRLPTRPSPPPAAVPR